MMRYGLVSSTGWMRVPPSTKASTAATPYTAFRTLLASVGFLKMPPSPSAIPIFHNISV